MAINRGEAAKLLCIKFIVPSVVKEGIINFAVKKFLHSTVKSDHKKVIMDSASDAYTRLIEPLMIRHLR
jgi:hypothetical protein